MKVKHKTWLEMINEADNNAASFRWWNPFSWANKREEDLITIWDKDDLNGEEFVFETENLSGNKYENKTI